jgi:hypothetical protein
MMGSCVEIGVKLDRFPSINAWFTNDPRVRVTTTSGHGRMIQSSTVSIPDDLDLVILDA